MRSLHAELHALVSHSMTPKTSYHITSHVLHQPASSVLWRSAQFSARTSTLKQYTCKRTGFNKFTLIIKFLRLRFVS